MAVSKDEKMSELYDGFVDDLLTVLKSGKVRAQDRAVIWKVLKDHGMAEKNPKDPRIQSLIENLPKFRDEDDSLDCV